MHDENHTTTPPAILRRHEWVGPALLSGLFIVLLGGVLWLIELQSLEAKDSDLTRATNAAVDSVASRLIPNRERLKTFARAISSGGQSERLRNGIAQFLTDREELLSIRYENPNRDTDWIIVRDGAAATPDAVIVPAESFLTFKRVQTDLEIAYSSEFLSTDGIPVFEVHVPVVSEGNFVGMVIGTYDCERVITLALPGSLFEDYRIDLLDSRSRIIASFPVLNSVDERLSRTVHLWPPGNGIAIRMQRYGSGFWGWGITVLILLSVSLVLGMAWGMFSLKKQIVKRAAAELALREARDELETRVAERTADLEMEVTERQKAEERLREHQDELTHVSRLSSLGEMAASLAHELHQPLGSIASYADGSMMLLEREELDRKQLSYALGEMAGQARRAGKIIHRLRDFVTERTQPKAIENIKHLTQEVIELIQPDARQRQIAIEFDIPNSLPPAMVDGIQIQQVMLNLLRNAIESMDDSQPPHTMTITTERIHSDEMEICVRDTGVGCSDEQLSRLFDSFFTTKDTGMGMGLAICRSIVEAHNGHIWATANDGPGLAFHFTVPIATAVVEAKTNQEPTVDSKPVEDERDDDSVETIPEVSDELSNEPRKIRIS